MQNLFLFADPIFGKFSTVYQYDSKAMNLLDFTRDVVIVQMNDIVINQHCLPLELIEEIIMALIDSYIECRQGSFAIPLICISKTILKRFYKRYFNLSNNDCSIDFAYRLSPMMQLLCQTDDLLVDRVAHANGHSGGMLFTILVSVNPVHGQIEPWYFDGETDLSPISTPLVYRLRNDVESAAPVAEIITGPLHYNLLFVRGKACSGGLVSVTYLKCPIIVFQITEFVPFLEVSIEMLMGAGWKSFGNLARKFFGKNAGIFVSITGNGVGVFDTGVPAIFEI